MRIAIVGCGPRGLSALERIISSSTAESAPVEVVIVEPGPLGSGIHDPEQPDYLLLNTICSQLTIFSDPAMTGGAPVTAGPDLFEWYRTQDPSVQPDDFLPRSVLGRYLRWAAEEIISRAPASVTVTRCRDVVTDVRARPDGAVLTTAEGVDVHADLVLVTTGHGLAGTSSLSGPADDLVSLPYPMPRSVDHIDPHATVAILGTGLTAMDLVASLTLGRGGRHVDGTGGLRYEPSGREPTIVLVNRSGYLPCARPRTTPGREPAPARYLTPEALAERRARTGGALDFRRDVEPLVVQEAMHRMEGATDAERRAVRQVLAPEPRTWDDAAGYRRDVVEHARRDLAAADVGLGASAVKEGLEVVRDHREVLRQAVDHPGLVASSHRYFMDSYAAVVNRAAIGPQKERVREVLALVERGVVVLGPGPSPVLTRAASGWTLTSTAFREVRSVEVDVVVQSALSWPETDPSRDPVSASLRTWNRSAGPALALDRDGFADGSGRSVAVFGPPAEGASYYNHYVPSPRVWSRALTDLDRVIVPALVRAAERASTLVG